jgi:LysR family glycine cleavage system transcriptional activator
MAVPSHLKALQALELAVRTGSLKEAAERLAITPAAVGQRIKALEDYLGIALIERGRAGVRPSDALAAALPELHRGFAALEAASRELDLQRWHEIHLAAASDFAELWLAPRLPRFREKHPNIRFCINGEGEVPMRLGRVDCEISFGAPGDDADLLFHDFAIPIASPTNFERVMQSPAETRLEGFPLLHLDFYRDDPAGVSWPEWITAAQIERSAPERGMRFRRIQDVLDAVEADAGLTICGLALILERVSGGRIRLPYPAESGLWTGHAFVARFRQDAAPRPHIRRFREWLAEEGNSTAAALARVAAGRVDRAGGD